MDQIADNVLHLKKIESVTNTCTHKQNVQSVRKKLISAKPAKLEKSWLHIGLD